MKQIVLIAFLLPVFSFAQEALRPLNYNLNQLYRDDRCIVKAKPMITAKQATASIQLPFIDDFSYADLSQYPDMTKWEDSMVYVNVGMPVAPLSFGVATFDGLDKFGYPHEPALTNQDISRPADTLTTKPINLASIGSVSLDPATDKVALSFYYQPRGYGEPPEPDDALMVDFYQAAQKKWVNVWSAPGISDQNKIDTTFKRAFIAIRDPLYFQDGFRFRFRNNATTSGNYDHWHIDYVYLNRNRDSIADTLYNDLTFANMPTPLLKNYAAMPWEQYLPREMAERNSVRIRNNFNVGYNMAYHQNIYSSTNMLLNAYDGNFTNLLPFATVGYSSFQPHANPAFNYSFQMMTDSTDFKVMHFLVKTGTATDFIPTNDTIYQFQQFRNYYAYDDGSCEAGYYLLGTSGKLAVKVQLNVTDTLRAMRIYFDPATNVKNDSATYKFRMTVWSDGGAGPGQKLFEDSYSYPHYLTHGERRLPEYNFKISKSTRILSPGIYYIGIQQYITTGIAFGFDRNYDFHQSLYYDVGNGWTQSVEKGSILIRPVFGAVVPSPTGIITNTKPAGLVFPVPADDMLFITGQEPVVSYRIISLSSTTVAAGETSGTIDTSNLPDGIYFLQLGYESGFPHTTKIIIQH